MTATVAEDMVGLFGVSLIPDSPGVQGNEMHTSLGVIQVGYKATLQGLREYLNHQLLPLPSTYSFCTKQG